VRPSPPSSADRARSAAVPTVVVLAGAALGVVSEILAYDWDDVRHWLPDLLTGLACIVAGAWSLRRRPATGVLLAATGALWFLGNIWAALLYAHRGPLVHLFVTYPGWRPGRWPQRVAVVLAYGVSVTRLWESDLAGPILATAALVLTIWSFAQSHGRARRDRLSALQASAAFAFAVTVGAVVRAAAPSADAVEPMLMLYEATVAWIAVFLASRLRPGEPAVVADLVVELGERQSGELRGALATTLGDPTLEVGFWTASGTYVDAAGTVLTLPAGGGDRVATAVERDGEPYAVLVHDAAVLDDPALAEAVATATRLAATNAVLIAEVQARLTELAASRRRLVVAADDERRRLATRLRHGVEQRVAQLRAVVEGAADDSAATVAGEHLRRAVDHLDHTATDLQHLARGLHPRELDAGLAEAITAVSIRCPVPVEVVIDGVPTLDDDTAAAAYYVCAEALTNLAKHAGATRAWIELSQRSRLLHVRVSDDGCGGADADLGSGLRGLTDRVEALGGTLTIASPPAGGTRLVAELPLDGGGP
jgi:signal transduction histidine kinase